MTIEQKIELAQRCMEHNIKVIIKYNFEAFWGDRKDHRVKEVKAIINKVYLPEPPTWEEIQELKTINDDLEFAEISDDDYYIEFNYECNLGQSTRLANIPIRDLEIVPIV